MKSKLDFKSNRKRIAAKLLLIDSGYQRDPIKARVKVIAENMELDALGIMSVSERANGKLYVVDGQHRLAALREVGLLDWECVCEVYHGLTVEDEAVLYRHLNHTRALKKADIFKAGLRARLPEPCAIEAIVHKHDLVLDTSCGHGSIGCVDAMERIYRTLGGDALDHVIGVAIMAWGKTAGAVEGAILSGLAVIHNEFGDAVEWDSLANTMARFPGGSSGVIGKARGLNAVMKKPLTWCIAKAIMDAYNSGKRKNRLELK